MAKPDQKAEGARPSNAYPIPLYLNQKHVFSVLAMMEGGFAQLENVKATWSDQDSRSNKAAGEVGVSNVFALLGIKLSGERATQHQNADTQEVSSERVHTPDSLFARMRERLHQEGRIKTESFENVTPGDYVEFKVTLRKNPLINLLETMYSFVQIAEGVQESASQQPRSVGSGRNKTQGPSGKPTPASPQLTSPISNVQMLKQLEVLLKSLKGIEGGTFDLIGTVTDSPMQVVLVLDPSFASDPTSRDLVDGEYTVLGKATRIVTGNSSDKINLLRKTSLGMAPAIVQQLVEILASMSTHGLSVPDKIETEVSGPAMQVVPVAIFI